MDKHNPNGSDLCTHCALCCDGSLFWIAQLQPRELENVNELGMSVSSNRENPGFILPCHLLVEKKCSIYTNPKKPKTCGEFKCKLLNRYLARDVDLQTALATVQNARDSLAVLQRNSPIKNDQPMTLRNIQLANIFLFSLSKEERAGHQKFLEQADTYITTIRNEFVEISPETTKEANKEK